jgi:PP-loop superfamily ATP-utilizing enzyme
MGMTKQEKLLIAFSGGAASTALASLIHQTQADLKGRR